MAKIQLKGITWGHSRGITPLVAYSQRFNELNPDVEVLWSKRTLQEFADYPLERLTGKYDLLIIDHPWVGRAAALGCVLPLDEHFNRAFLDDQAANSVGNSHPSYLYDGHQWALAIDAATPAASYRADLFHAQGLQIPKTWNDLIILAKSGQVAVPGIPVDLLMNFYMFCLAHGKEPFENQEAVIDDETGIKALLSMKELYSLVDPVMFHCNPIAVAEMMSSTDKYLYCPFAYCYSNYSRDGYADKRLTYAQLVEFKSGGPLKSTLGGTGIAISSSSRNIEWAVKYVGGIMSAGCQSTFYVENGGQPGHRAAWTNELSNRLTHNFFRDLVPVLDNAYTRPRYNGYLSFQDHGGDVIRDFLMKNGEPGEVISQLNQLYKRSFSEQQPILN